MEKGNEEGILDYCGDRRCEIGQERGELFVFSFVSKTGVNTNNSRDFFFLFAHRMKYLETAIIGNQNTPKRKSANWLLTNELVQLNYPRTYFSFGLSF